MNSDQWTRANELFLAAVELPSENRSAYLDSACQGDAELRQEIEQLLAADREVDEAFLQPVTDLPRQALCNEDPWIGRRVSHYEIRSLLGAGGMGRVYLAARVEDYSEQVVIKFLRHEMVVEDTLRRFRNEMQIQAELGGHPNISRLLDAGATEDGFPFFVMEYVNGEENRSILRPTRTHCCRSVATISYRLRGSSVCPPACSDPSRSQTFEHSGDLWWGTQVDRLRDCKTTRTGGAGGVYADGISGF